MSDPNFSQRVFESPTGAQLALYEQAASGDARGIVHINHGLAEHGARYAPFANFLACRGYHVAAHDHRGHGATTAADGAPRRFADENGWQKVMDDVAAVQDALKSQWPDLPLITFGHSMGSVIAFNHVLRHPESSAAGAFWNGNMALGGMVNVMRFVLWCEALVGGPYTPSNTIDALTFKAWNKRFPERRTDADWLSRDPVEVDKYVADPLGGWPASVSLWRDFIGGVQYAEDTSNLAILRKDFPIHLIGGSKDPATDNGRAVRKFYKRLKRAGFKDIDFKILKGFRHETLNEVGREVQMDAFAAWADRVTA